MFMCFSKQSHSWFVIIIVYVNDLNIGIFAKITKKFMIIESMSNISKFTKVANLKVMTI